MSYQREWKEKEDEKHRHHHQTKLPACLADWLVVGLSFFPFSFLRVLLLLLRPRKQQHWRGSVESLKKQSVLSACQLLAYETTPQALRFSSSFSSFLPSFSRGGVGRTRVAWRSANTPGRPSSSSCYSFQQRLGFSLLLLFHGKEGGKAQESSEERGLVVGSAGGGKVFVGSFVFLRSWRKLFLAALALGIIPSDRPLLLFLFFFFSWQQQWELRYKTRRSFLFGFGLGASWRREGGREEKTEERGEDGGGEEEV